MKHMTLLFLLKDDKILLAMKKRGFGVGRWNGVGGKLEGSETIEEAAIRECYEEIGVTPHNLEKVAHLNFFFPGEAPSICTHTFVSRRWTGEPAESEEMAPKWFLHGEIPYGEMWQDDKHWLPPVIEGNKVVASFSFDEQDNLLTDTMKVETVDTLEPLSLD